MTATAAKYATVISVIATLAVATPGLGEALAAKTYATYWFDATDNYYGVSAEYKVDDRVRTGWLADATWFQTANMNKLLEIGWIDQGGSHTPFYYCAFAGSIHKTWGSPSDGSSTTYYIYDLGDDGTFDLIGGSGYCQRDIGTYNLIQVQVGYEDSKNSNVIEDDLHGSLKYYDGTWHYWDWPEGAHGKVESHITAEVDYCTDNYEAEIGDTANC